MYTHGGGGGGEGDDDNSVIPAGGFKPPLKFWSTEKAEPIPSQKTHL
jgi:hypothetical protein